MKTVTLVKKSSTEKWPDVDRLVCHLEEMPNLRVGNSIKVCTNMIFEGLDLFHPFNMFLKAQRMKGVICLMINLDQ